MNLMKRASGASQRGGKAMPTVPVILHLPREQFETAQYLADKLGIRLQTLLKRLISDGLCGRQRAARLKNWR